MALNDLKANHMMAHLTEALDKKQDIGHFGRLVYTIVARHFLSEDELVAQLAKDKDFDDEQARGLVQQVQGQREAGEKARRPLDGEQRTRHGGRCAAHAGKVAEHQQAEQVVRQEVL